LAKFRVETITDPNTGKVYAELYYPNDEKIPLAKTDPIFPNHDIAVQKTKYMFKEWISQLGEEH
jgi:hypothetical protein